MNNYKDHCDECDMAMTRLSRDGSLIYCDWCGLPKPVPSHLLSSGTRMAEVKRLKGFQSKRP